MKTLGLSMIVRDEAEMIWDCIQPLATQFNQIVVLDTGSIDDTPDFARQAGAHEVYSTEWRCSFATARNEALNKMKTDWVLILDADERMDPQHVACLSRFLQDAEPAVYCLKIINIGSGQSDIEHYTPRLFPRLPGVRFEGVIHEQIVSSPPLERKAMDGIEVIHHGYSAEQIEKKSKRTRNAELLSKALESEPENAFNHFNLGAHHYSHGEFAEAEVCFRACIERMPDPLPSYGVTAFNHLVTTLIEQRKYKQGLKVSYEAPHQCFGSSEFWCGIGSCLNELQRYHEAFGAFREAMSTKRNAFTLVRDPGASTWKPLLGMANAFLMLGYTEKARSHYEQALKHKPNHPGILKTLKRLS